MRNTIITSTILAAAFAFSPLALAANNQAASATSTAKAGATKASSPHRHHHKRHMHRGGHHGMHALRKLDLTDAQRSDIRQLARDSFEQAKPTWKALRQKRMALKTATPGSAAYQRAANDLAHAEANAASARVLRRADLDTKIHNMLTPAQRTQLVELREQRINKMKQWRESHEARRAKAQTTTPSSPRQ